MNFVKLPFIYDFFYPEDCSLVSLEGAFSLIDGWRFRLRIGWEPPSDPHLNQLQWGTALVQLEAGFGFFVSQGLKIFLHVILQDGSLSLQKLYGFETISCEKELKTATFYRSRGIRCCAMPDGLKTTKSTSSMPTFLDV